MTTQRTDTFIVREGTVEEAREGEALVPEFSGVYPPERYADVLGERDNLILIAEASGETIGYLVGYDVGRGVFYSWQGGVSPDWREKGVGAALRQAQEEWAAHSNYHTVRAKTKNHLRAQLTHLVTAGYDVVAVEGSGIRAKVVLEKDLLSHNE